MSDHQSSTPEPKWKDLYTIGWVTAALNFIIVTFAVIGYFIWSYLPETSTTAEIFDLIQQNPFSAAIGLDVLLLAGIVLAAPLVLAVYIVLRKINPSYAMLALLINMIAVVAMIIARPVTEIFMLSDRYMAAATPDAQAKYLAAADALLVMFDGTAWAISTTFTAIGYLIFFFLMLKTDLFRKATAYVGISTNVSALLAFVPGIGQVQLLLLFVATFGGLANSILLMFDFLRMTRQAQANRQVV